ncbi:MAG: hypothetical protein AAGJ46_17895 [Planctomycetota bacterium]
MRSLCASVTALAVVFLVLSDAPAAQFMFGQNANDLTGESAGDVTRSGVTMSLTTTVAGAVFNENGSRGLGSNSRATLGAADAEIDRFNVLGGTLAGEREGVEFSFDVDGFVTELFFDGLSDEAFEFFRLETPTGEVLSLFDSEVGLRLTSVDTVDEPNVTLLVEAGAPDDDLFDLRIPFRAGQIFRLIYGEYQPEPADLAPGFTTRLGNGGRFEGVTVRVAPEPASLAVFAVCLGALPRRRNQKRVL